jgi:hypothetical protein
VEFPYAIGSGSAACSFPNNYRSWQGSALSLNFTEHDSLYALSGYVLMDDAANEDQND